MEYTGANSYWPNAMFFARAIPNHSTRIVTIVTGHHEGRVGELFVFDPAKGRHETEGVLPLAFGETGRRRHAAD